ncbi:hypothetical protein N7527_011077 [Penicillium freii]|nr:hypothetical protein N7527_011077 [Penicillium freii]
MVVGMGYEVDTGLGARIDARAGESMAVEVKWRLKGGEHEGQKEVFDHNRIVFVTAGENV